MKVGIIGVNGYTGQELVRILSHHPDHQLTEATARIETPMHIKSIAPQFRHLDLVVTPANAPEEIQLGADVYILALPHETAMDYAAFLLTQGKKVIDLSADFRFRNLRHYEDYYVPHRYPELNEEAVYGLPELYREKIRNAG